MDGGFFNIGFGELMLILLLAGLVMGPQRIRQVARWFGRVSAQLQSVSRAFLRQLDNELDAEAKGELKAALSDLQALQKEVTDLRRELREAPRVLGTQVQQARTEAEDALRRPDLANAALGAAAAGAQAAEDAPRPLPTADDDEAAAPAPLPTAEASPSAADDDEAEHSIAPPLPRPLDVPGDEEV